MAIKVVILLCRLEKAKADLNKIKRRNLRYHGNRKLYYMLVTSMSLTSRNEHMYDHIWLTNMLSLLPLLCFHRDLDLTKVYHRFYFI